MVGFTLHVDRNTKGRSRALRNGSSAYVGQLYHDLMTRSYCLGLPSKRKLWTPLYFTSLFNVHLTNVNESVKNFN